MGNLGSMVSSGLSGLSGLFGGGGSLDMSGGGTGLDQFGNPVVSGSPMDSFFGMSDPTGSMGAAFSQNYGGDGGGGPFASTSGGGGDGGGSGDQSQQPAQDARQAPSSMAPANYQPAPGPSTQQADPGAWQIGGAGRSLGPTGFVQQTNQAVPWASAPQSWVQSTGVPTNLTSGDYPGATFDERFPGAGGTSVVAKDQPAGQQGDQTAQGPSGGTAQDMAKDAGVQTGPSVINTVASVADAPPAAVDQQGGGETPAATTAQGDTSQVDQQQGQQGQRGGGGGPQQMPQFRGPPGMQSMGNLFRDIQGLMSGNPMSLMSLMGDVMRMIGGGGMPGMGMPGMGGGGMPGMPGMGGQQPWQNQPWAPGYNPQTGQWASPQARQTALQQIAQGMPAPGGPNPGQGPRAGQRPGQQPGESFEDAQKRNQPPAASAAAAPAAATGPTGTGAAAQPLQANEVQTPGYRGAAPMKPTQGSVDRSRFANENNQATMERAAWMVRGELGNNASVRQQIVQLETAFNRAQYRGHSLGHSLLDTRSNGGYYDGNSAHPTYRMSAKPTPEQLAAFKRDVWDPVMKGSNLSDIGYGPMTGNASQGLAARQMQRMHGYTMQTGESYFREAPFNYPLPALKAAQSSPWGDPRVTSLPQLAG